MQEAKDCPQQNKCSTSVRHQLDGQVAMYFETSVCNLAKYIVLLQGVILVGVHTVIYDKQYELDSFDLFIYYRVCTMYNIYL